MKKMLVALIVMVMVILPTVKANAAEETKYIDVFIPWCITNVYVEGECIPYYPGDEAMTEAFHNREYWAEWDLKNHIESWNKLETQNYVDNDYPNSHMEFKTLNDNQYENWDKLVESGECNYTMEYSAYEALLKLKEEFDKSGFLTKSVEEWLQLREDEPEKYEKYNKYRSNYIHHISYTKTVVRANIRSKSDFDIMPNAGSYKFNADYYGEAYYNSWYDFTVLDVVPTTDYTSKKITADTEKKGWYTISEEPYTGERHYNKAPDEEFFIVKKETTEVNMNEEVVHTTEAPQVTTETQKTTETKKQYTEEEIIAMMQDAMYNNNNTNNNNEVDEENNNENVKSKSKKTTKKEKKRTGWYKKDGKKYYYNKNGKMVKGLKKINGKYYYFNKKGQMITKKWKTIKGKKYYFGKNGKATKIKKVKKK